MPWPELTTQLISKHLPTNIHAELGHIKVKRQGLGSTKYFKTYDSIYTTIHNNDKTFMDLTGRFLYKSRRVNEHISIVYHIDSNAIIVTPIKNRQASTITQDQNKLENIV